MKTIIVAALAIVALPAFAEAPAHISVQVSDLNLSVPAGVETLKARFVSAIEKACSTKSSSNLTVIRTGESNYNVCVNALQVDSSDTNMQKIFAEAKISVK